MNACRNQNRGDVDAKDRGASPRGWQGGWPVVATKIEDVHPGANIQCGDERVSAVPHGCGEAGEIALLPQCPVRVDRRICHGQNLSFSKAPVQFVASRHSLAIASTRSEEHTSELQSLMRLSYAVLFLNKRRTA